MDTLALGYTLPAIGRVTDLHRLENVRAGRTGKNGEMALHAVSPFSHFTPTSVLPGTSYRHPPEVSVCRIPCRALFLEGGNKG